MKESFILNINNPVLKIGFFNTHTTHLVRFLYTHPINKKNI